MIDKNLFRAFGKISPEYIEEASPDNKMRVEKMPMKWISLTACILLIAVIGVLVLHDRREPSVTPPDPPIDVGQQLIPPENDDPPVSSGGDITPPDTPSIGGSDTSFSRKYIDEVYNLYICDETVGREAGDKWVNEVYLKRSPEEQEALPTIYQMIVDLDIPKKALEKTNERLGGDELQQSTIDALYLDSVEDMMKALKNPLALYYEGEIYTFDELRVKRYSEIPVDVLSEYFDGIEQACEENGTLKYDLELIENARLLYGIE